MPSFLFLALAATCVFAAYPTLPNVTLGPVEVVVDWPTQHCTCAESPGCTDPHDPDYSDTPPRAYVSSDGVAHLWSSDAESRQSLRLANVTSDPFFHNCSVHAASQLDCRPPSYNFQTWLHSPYMMPDGDTAFALVHMEYHGWQVCFIFCAPKSALARPSAHSAPPRPLAVRGQLLLHALQRRRLRQRGHPALCVHHRRRRRGAV